MSSEMVRIWHYAGVNKDSTFRDFQEHGEFHNNVLAKALREEVLQHSGEPVKTSPRCGRAMHALEPTKNPILMRMPSIKQRNAERVIEAAELLGGAWLSVDPDGLGFVVRPAKSGGAVHVTTATPVPAIITWAEKHY